MDDPQPWLQTANRVLIGVGLAINTPLLVMRIYTKIRLMRKFWWDDVCLILAWMFSLGTQAVILYGFGHAGYGIHASQLPLSVLSTYRKCMLAASTIYVPALAFAKLALLMLYYRLLQATHPRYIYAIYAVGFIIASYSIALSLALIFGCSPIQKSWDVTVTGSCINISGVYLATAITNTISDVTLMLLPIPIVWGLRLPVIQKIGVLCMFGVGFLTTSISIVRLATLMPLVTSQDQTHDIALAAIFINIEANTIIICGSFPYLRQFLRYHAPRWIDYSLSSRRKYSSTESPSAPVRKPGLTQLQDDIERAVNHTDGMASVEGNIERGPREVL
ncbi:hypothetical protein BDV27DRAFT_104573 [Aspergillus caelatus]|uniref:Rhodopsin domain-containing protein n=2 Tax=Aspergillus subgen. Circumdati TaxID=2720871 RepID=A0A5N7ALR3_9EURO|nr:uncharacterized protein BDV27DRAFT_104573 [Aspergillus caelatus]KAE8369948.1 hypothetical protein BDV27DRAFT_104573 [Aspergillus caelatus]KAE8419539.1 hypothetical protein BDV36DRAFT_294132 [Aspergillus pseudocaelatus]